MTYIEVVEFTWREAKAAKNKRKHGITFEQAKQVWNDPGVAYRFDSEYDGELRWFAIGKTDLGLLLTVVHVVVDETIFTIHIISAWRANAYDENYYQEHNP